MVSYAQEERSISPGFDLVFDEVVPRMLFVICKIGSLALLRAFFDKILVGTGDFAKVSQMPVERCIVLDRISSNCRHNYVATVARVARNGEGPCLGGAISVGTLGPRRQHQDEAYDEFRFIHVSPQILLDNDRSAGLEKLKNR